MGYFRTQTASDIVPPTPPANTVLPVISGTTTVGQTLTTTTGTWTGTATITYAYQWKRNGTNIAAATSSTYSLVTADATTNITVTVTATNGLGSASATSTAVGPVTAAGALAENKRSNINMDSPYGFSYALIDHLKQADSWCSPMGSAYRTTTLTFMQSTDAQGWPNNPAAVNEWTGGGPHLPGTDQFAGPYVLTWIGDGTVSLDGNYVWTANTTSSAGDTTNTYTQGGNAFTNKVGQTARAIINCSGNPGQTLITFRIAETGMRVPISYLRNVKFYRLEDEADLLAGNVFRRPFKQHLIDYNGHNIRMLDWDNVNDSTAVRFEHRNMPDNAGWFNNYAASGMPKYGNTTVSGSGNAFAVAAVSGTPTSMQHGEQAHIRVMSDIQRQQGPILVTAISRNNTATNTVTANGGTLTGTTVSGTKNITSIAWIGPKGGIFVGYPIGGAGIPAGATITSWDGTTLIISANATASASGVALMVGHGFANGDTIQIQMEDDVPGSAPTGMMQLHDVPCVISNVQVGSFDIPVNTSTYTPFTIGCAYQYVTLQVGSGNDRVPYPVVFYNGITKLGRFPFLFGGSGGYLHRPCVFHKEIKASSTVTGAWLVPRSGFSGQLGMPIEIMVKLCNELQAMGPRNPINLWVHLPALGLISADASYDSTYSAASNYAAGMVDVIMNPSSTKRAAGWSELNSACTLYVEHANETWNFDIGYCLSRIGYQRWPTSGYNQGKYQVVRAAQAANDIRAAFPAHPRIKFINGMFTTLGPSDPRNDIRINGDADQFAAMGSSNKMLSYFDYLCMAWYFYNDGHTPANSIAAGTTAFVAAGANDAAVEAACVPYANGFKFSALGGNETMDRYATLLSQYAAAASAQGKRVIGYEGGWDHGLPDYDTIAHATTRATFNGTVNVTAVDAGTITPGWYILGDGIPPYTRVVSSASGTMVLSAAATISRRGFFTYMPPRDAFLTYFKRSQTWADAYLTSHLSWNTTANADAPPEFTFTNAGGGDRWTHTLEDSYANGVEYAGSDRAWLALAARNRST